MDDLDIPNQPQQINIWLASLHSSTISAANRPAVLQAQEAKREAILALLAKLALHYWRPDFTAPQAKQLYSDYIEDLAEYPFADVHKAIQEYRRNGANRFYPTIGQLVDLMLGKEDLERENPGAPDRLQTIHRIKRYMRAEGKQEVLTMADRLESGETLKIERK